MYQNTFEALAINTKLISRNKISNEKWREIGCFFIQNYVEQLGKAEKVVIGHIKVLIELEDNSFIKLSCVSQDRPTNCEIVNTEGHSLEAGLTFNSIISEVLKVKNIQYFHMALERTCSVYGLMTDYKEILPRESKTAEQEAETCPVYHEHHHHNEKYEHNH
ncbi:hypothetical protein [Acetobacterium tundrae]|uniref:Uncharacterized protein n=1 Tax=Acetobacterium tundrae TaxID=132932 RepID=A0ABR6WHC7_9FIRM|nr:hypothetical protein [Acetobacterium tundrae]MBC3795873.1 hypothetical protein [Acetobacterium tundrae]